MRRCHFTWGKQKITVTEVSVNLGSNRVTPSHVVIGSFIVFSDTHTKMEFDLIAILSQEVRSSGG